MYEVIGEEKVNGYLLKRIRYPDKPGGLIDTDAQIDDTVFVDEHSIVFAGAEVRGETTLTRSIVGNGVRIYDSTIADSRMYGDCKIFCSRLRGVFVNGVTHNGSELTIGKSMISAAENATVNIEGNPDISFCTLLELGPSSIGNDCCLKECNVSTVVGCSLTLGSGLQHRLHTDVRISNCNITGNLKATQCQLGKGVASLKGDLDSDMVASIEAQLHIPVIQGEDGDYVICYKWIRSDFKSEYDKRFLYPSSGFVETTVNVTLEHVSCAEGLHFAGNDYEFSVRSTNGRRRLVAKVMLSDIVAVQGGKIRCKRAEVIGYSKVIETKC